jgi:uncharacterized protein YkwD
MIILLLCIAAPQPDNTVFDNTVSDNTVSDDAVSDDAAFKEWVDSYTATSIPDSGSEDYSISYNISSAQQQLLNLTNQYRASHGKSALIVSPTLMSSAQRYANHMASTNRFSHSSRSWRGNASENISWSSSGSPYKAVYVQYANSSGHRSNMLGNWTYTGQGYATSANGREYSCQHYSNNPTGASTSQPYGQTTRRYRTTTSRNRSGLFRRWFGR